MATGGRYAELWRSQTEGVQPVTSGPAVAERIIGDAGAALAV